MKKLTATLLLGCLMAGSAFAAPADPAMTAYTGSYEMADGRILTVSEQDGQLHASVTSRSAVARNARYTAPREVVLKETAPDQFTSTTTPLRVTFGQGAHGDIAQVTLSDRGEPMMASR